MVIYSYSIFGYEGSLVQVETDLRRGIPAVDIAGLADGSVKESRERIRAAFAHSGMNFPDERVLVSLAPADLKKEGSGFDLAMAVSIMTEEYSEFKDLKDERWLVMGELGLSGSVRPVSGVFAAMQTACRNGIRYALIPEGNKEEAQHFIRTGMNVFTVSHLKDIFYTFTKKENPLEAKTVFETVETYDDGVDFTFSEDEMDLKDIQVDRKTMDAAIIAVAGKHNIFLAGNRGCGKTRLLHYLQNIVPDLTEEEKITADRIRSIAGLPVKDGKKAPFREPHQTATLEEICGGGSCCRPGEITLAHNGVLFLVEAAEFRSSVLQVLRIPYENHSVTLCRAGRSTVYPARFQLFMTASPCPCGNYEHNGKICLCSARSVDMYWKKFSSPLLDKIEVKVWVKASPETIHTETTGSARRKVSAAIQAQRDRGFYNAYMTYSQMEEWCLNKATEEAKQEVEKLAEKTGVLDNQVMNERKKVTVWKLARTVADMDRREDITLSDVKKAVEVSGIKEDIFSR